MTRTAVLASTLLAMLAGCKAKEAATQQGDSEVAKDLEACRAAKVEKDKLIAALQDENAKLQVKKGGGEVVVVIEGGNFTVKPGPPGEPMPIDPKIAAES